ncbi:TonB-dependent receptor [Saccharobesus litoralis]|uniref:TonB-dependent receptor n=1 Tax=Saccharobesus litoralis TaxID=2172099 RepID=A0A2S0VLB6_9ALTE|nr:TonB-dependent receptor [Saccharobesus litoralis]AWB65003.1 TonB-dependent receptor [Saccharobesus litoralis]
MTHQFKLKAISVAIAASFMATPLYAAPEDDKEKAEDDVEVIEITGFSASLRKAMNAKRFAAGVSDSIHAEDVGKSTDQNIADALSRVTGVTVQEEGGEGTRISIRGAGAHLNQISMNGVALTGGLSDPSGEEGQNNSVDLSTFSSDILASIDVQKTASADQDEGSLGGSVILNTVKPLNLNKPRRNFTIEARHNEFAGESDYRLNASFSEKFLDDTLGFMVTVSKDTQSIRQDRINIDWADGAVEIMDSRSGGANRVARNLAKQEIRVQNYQRYTREESQAIAQDNSLEGMIKTDDNGNRLLVPLDTLEGYDANDATQYLHQGDLFVLARENADFSLNTDDRERFSLSTAIQFRPTDETEIQLDINHTKQDVYTDNQVLRMNISPLVLIHEDDDNLELNTVDVGTNTLERSLSRSQTGEFRRTQGLRTQETNVVTLNLEQQLTDDLKMSLKAGYSKTSDETPDLNDEDRFLTIGTAQWGTRQPLEAMPVQETIGYDCLSGSLEDCSWQTGTQNAEFDAFDGSINSATSRFNPFDVFSRHLGNFNLRNNKQDDTNKSIFLDFDWDVDLLNITTLEFGAKWAKRNKDVRVQDIAFTNSRDLQDVESGEPLDDKGLQSVKLIDILASEAFPYNDFAEDLQIDRGAAFFGGWPMLDANKALTALADKDGSEIGFRPRIGGTRFIETETLAAYFKANFEFFDGQLTGNVGVRYIKDESVATGVGGINFIGTAHMFDPYNLLIERGLADIEGSPQCPQAIMQGTDQRYQPVNNDQLTGCWDWAITHAYIRNDANTFPVDENGNWQIAGANGQVGPDVNRRVRINYDTTPPTIEQNDPRGEFYNIAGDLITTSNWNHRQFGAQGVMWPYLDRSTMQWGPAFEKYGIQVQERTAFVTNTGEADIWLPSLNLNYALSDKMIGRFAVTKTMTRPNFDSLNPRVQITEQQWEDSSGSAGNTKLQPLSSTNIDVSWEWYFNESGLLSVALFHKDMVNFEETINTPYHYKDVREDYELSDADLLLDYKASREVGDADNCMPLRLTGGFFDEWNITCDIALIDVVKNGRGATTKGLELNYNQTYDMLPGALSALGVSFNYTYQQSESDAEEIGTSGVFLKPLPQPFTPENSANTTIFWEKDGIQLRLASRYTDVQLVNRGLTGAATWQEASNRIDFSSSYKLTDNLSITFQATNLTDETRRIFLTSANTKSADTNDLDRDTVYLDEGNALEGGVSTTRTAALYKTGRQFRLGLRGTF